MSAKRDRQGVRTATDLERKYNFGESVTQAYVQSSIRSALTAATNEYKEYVDGLLDDSVKTVNGVIPDDSGAVTINTKDLTDEEIADLMSHLQ